MRKLTSTEIRQLWLDFFKSKDHYELKPASLIPVDDPSLLWINSGVATLKPYFDGRKTPPAKRLTNSQKSIRTNDIENVGHTARHHTLFEMLGNFSIGDYFKKEAIEFAWEFLTSPQWIGFDPAKLYITIYEEDEEAYHIWKDIIGLSDDRIIKGGKDTNFWEIGEGPCGPNTEIFYDRGEKYDPQHVGLRLLKEDIENDRYLEVWNIVFSQFNNNGDGTYSELPRKNIDTGAGLERITSIIQETPTNFETDLFLPIIKATEKIISNKYQYDPSDFWKEPSEQTKINTAFKVIADHIRAATFAIADGVFPSNKDRGYVIRRLIRRASLYGKKLGINQPFLYLLVIEVINAMVPFYDYLIAKQEIITQAIKDEEVKFLNTLEQGSKLFNELKEKYGEISKENAFKLFESYGFPIELIEEEAADNNIKVDSAGFYQLLEQAKDLSRTNRKNIKAMHLQNELFTKLDVASEFVGYEVEEVKDAKVVFMFAHNQEVKVLSDQEGYLILNRTPFYAEKGGQAADHGIITSANATIQVVDVQQGPNKQNIHHVIVNGTIKLGAEVNALIDKDKRFYTRKNHSGTHLLHAALREVLGTHAMQTGSYNDEERLRIDITHNQNITSEEISKVEASVSQAIKAAIPCEVIYTNMDEALNKYHALAFFTEKYDEIVRIVRFGTYSCELCGGTHVANSQEVEDLMVTGVESKGAGTYRVHAITSHKTIAAYLNDEFLKIKNEVMVLIDKYNQGKENLPDENLESLWNQINDLAVSKEHLKQLKDLILVFKEQYKQWNKKYANFRMQEHLTQYQDLSVTTINNINVLYHRFNVEIDLATLKALVDNYKAKYDNLLVFFVDFHHQDDYKLVVGVSKDLQTQYQAGNIVKKLNPLIEGNGGGNPSVAQSGFKNKTMMLTIMENLFTYLDE
ncbi:alanine--tRNA ligase [Spiroplasma eriocheiris]|uniref:Alanine--tRNA ligase n=1 Tax=Spiroplasma eriocheiris TaxID=315358 RepID=A0A0H3XMG1_9MOLU|nr:alanine--tRNA ligase [Spiroplasma eriocheiris]AHF57659.1 alanyl-tRNA synthetase [Spiroplasma eriocheiris CCTCC M 207170]AKM54112.1 alanyl-tRNA synthetase [Spiroplasma eriocheiris]